jgi:hypothetical protein
MNFLPRNWEGYYAFSSKMGGKLCLLIGVRTLPFIHLDIDLVHDNFCLVGKPTSENIPKNVGLDLAITLF